MHCTELLYVTAVRVMSIEFLQYKIRYSTTGSTYCTQMEKLYFTDHTLHNFYKCTSMHCSSIVRLKIPQCTYSVYVTTVIVCKVKIVRIMPLLTPLYSGLQYTKGL
jgi:hypothetical protein